MNKYPVATNELAQGLATSSAALVAANNSIEEQVALLAAGNATMQDISSVASGLKIVAARLRGTTTDIDDDADSAITNVSKLQSKIKALTAEANGGEGIDIINEQGEYKSTYEILREISEIFDKMDDVSSASLLELIAGKNRSSVVAAILQNGDILEDAYADAFDSEGSSQKELETYLDSIQGRIDLFDNSVQTMWMNFISTDVVKFIVNVGTGLVKLADNIGLIETALMGIVAYVTFFKKQSLSDLIFGGKLSSGGNKKIQLLDGNELSEEIEKFNEVLSQKSPEAFAKYKLSAKEAGNGMDILADKVEAGAIKTKDGKVATEDYVLALQRQTDAAKKAAQAEQTKRLAMNLTAMAVAGIISAIKYYVNSIKTLEDRYEELQSNISTIESGISSLDSELKSIEDQIDALSNKNLTISEAEELKNLKEQSEELQRQKELRENILSVYGLQNEITSLEMFNQKIRETAAGQEKAKESAKTWAKWIGIIADIALIAGGVAVTGLSGGLATAAGAAMIGAGSAGAGSAVTELAADAWGGKSKSVGEDLTAWYESYIDAIATVDQEAQEAESQYLSNVSDANYNAWQKKLDASNTLKEDLYNNLAEMQEYIDNLEYNDSTKSTIDGYNDLLTHIDIQFNDNNIESQISSIESLKSEFYELSKGVDENGKNVTLSAEEYARYCDIVDQVLAYAPGLISSYDEQGNAILYAAGAQITYNDLLAESIELLKEQRRQAAEDAVSDESLGEMVSSVKSNYNSANKNIGYNKLPYAYYEGIDVSGGDVNTYVVDYDAWDAIEKSVGKNKGAFQKKSTYIKNNLEAIAENRDAIIEQIQSEMGSKGFNQNDIDAYIDSFNLWLNELISQKQSAIEQANAMIRETLYLAPQSSEYYDDLSGSQVAFINSYIIGLEDLKDKSKDEIAAIRDELLTLTDNIGQNEDAQALIDDLFALDPSKLSVQKYKDSIAEIFQELIDDDIITSDQKETLYSQLFSDNIDNMDFMQEQVAAKLKEGSKGLAAYLTGTELQIAYKYLLTEADDSLSFQELKQKIAEYSNEIDGPIVNTYSTLQQQTKDYNDVVLQTAEIVADNTLVTQEYKDALTELGISAEDLAECFDDTNDLVVTNAEKLQELVKAAKKDTAQNIKLAKSQARLKYYELFKEMQNYVDENGNVVAGKQEEILALSQEMNALEKVIAKYSMLETQLLGTANAYETFQQAQEADAETDYIGEVEDMALALGQVFNTAELGNETAQAAIAGLVPESVYKDLDTVDEKIAAIYDYFNNGPLSQYLTLEFDDDGNIASAEMTLDNLQKFIEDGLENGVFVGSDWQHFDLSEDIDSLDALAEQYNITTDQAFAYIKAIDDHDIEWLNGDYSSILDQFESTSYEQGIYNAMNGMAELNAQLAEGKISADEYSESYKLLVDEFDSAKEASRTNMFGEDGVADKTPDEIDAMNIDDIDNYYDAYQKCLLLTEDLEEATRDYEAASDVLKTAQEEGREATEEEIAAYENAKKTVEDTSKELAKAVEKKGEFTEPTELEVQVALNDIEAEIAAAGDKFDGAVQEYFELDENGYYVIKAGLDANDVESKMPGIGHHVNLLNSRTTLIATGDTEELSTQLSDIYGQLEEIINSLQGIQISLDPESVAEFSEQLGRLLAPQNLWVNLKSGVSGWVDETFGGSSVNGTAHYRGTIHASGNWGLPASEHDSLMGELGPEIVVDPHSGRYYTVGDNGAEMVDLPKGAIIFNHKQTEGLLKNGYIASRGKAYAEGNAHVTIFDEGASSNSSSSSSSSADDVKDELEEVFDWIEVRLEEINKDLDFRSAQLENKVGYQAQNKTIDQMLALNEKLYDNLTAGANKYYSYAKTLLAKIPAEYRKAAQDGTIAIETFTGEVGEDTLEAIQEYREWVQKGDDATQQAEETLTEISNLTKQAIDNIATDFENKNSIRDNKIDQLEAYNGLAETKYGSESASIYKAIIKETKKNISALESQRDKMQAELNKQVEAGNIKKYSQNWYDAINDIAAVDTEIIELTKDTYDYQDAINELHWDNFDNLMSRFEAISDEAGNLIDILGSKDLVDKDTGEWTDEGVTTLGLYAQQMEIAEMQAKKYEEEIKYLNKNWKKLGYTEQEYVEKLDELKDGQYDAIKSYNDTKDAIVDLNKERVDAIKDGIQKEIDAYSELIEKKKEELSAEKDLYDFQKNIADKQKNIADIERKLAALSADSSASARAKRAQLEADLAEAQAELQETYYDRSISDQQDALDKELENFQNEKDAELDSWDEYLENTEQVVSDSLTTIQENTNVVYQTLQEMGQEYSLSIAEALTSPWEYGETAIQSYSEQFGLAMSSTVEELQKLATEYKEIMAEIENVGSQAVKNVNASADQYTAATKSQASSSSASSASSSASTSTNSSSTTSGLVSSLSGNIQYGDTGSKVKKLQQALNELGYGNSGTSGLDGIFGTKTHAAVQAFQKAMGISADGIVGPDTKNKFKLKGYASGTTGVKNNQLALIDELGEELIMRAGPNGRLQYLTKGTSVIPSDISENLMRIGQLDPQAFLDQNRPQVAASPSVVNNTTEIHIDNSVGELIHVERLDGNNPAELTKIVDKAWDKRMKELNSHIRRYTNR